jgi:hypothetical protein
MPSGTIVEFSTRNSMFIVQIDAGDYAAFEPLDPIGLKLGDVLIGQLDAYGHEKLLHRSQRATFSVYGQTGPLSLLACRRVVAADWSLFGHRRSNSSPGL